MPKPDYGWLQKAWKIARQVREAEGEAGFHTMMARQLSAFALDNMDVGPVRSTVIEVLSELAQFCERVVEVREREE